MTKRDIIDYVYCNARCTWLEPSIYIKMRKLPKLNKSSNSNIISFMSDELLGEICCGL